MIRKIFLLLSLILYLGMQAQRPLRILSQVPVQGTEEARSLMFDHYGMMWVGTDQGLRAFDGYRFRTYRSDAYTPGILPNNYIRSMTEDQHDGLWIGTRDGLARYDRRNGTFKTYHLRGGQARLINALFTTRDGTIWAGTNAGVARYDAEKDDFIDINMPFAVASFAEDKHGNLFIGTWEGGLLRLNKESGRMVSYPRLNERNTAQTLLMDSRERLWIGTWEHGIIRMDHPENEHDPGMHKINEGRRDFRTFHRLVEDSVSHAIWGCCIEGLTSVDLDDDTQVENYPILTFCYDMLTDGMGNLWVITRNKGIVHLSTRPSPFRFHHLNPKGLVLPVNRIQTLFTNDGRYFWLGLQPYGLALYDRKTNQVAYNSQIPGMEQVTGQEGLYVRTVYDILERADGSLWIATSHGIIVWKEGTAARLLPLGSMPFLTESETRALHNIRDGKILVGQANGVGIALSEDKGRMLYMAEDDRNLSSCNVRAITEDYQHRLWIATEGEGIIRITGDVSNPKGFTCHQYAPLKKNYPVDEAISVYEDEAHSLWAISGSGELFLYDDENDVFSPVNHLYHISMDGLYSILGDGVDGLWLSTDKGLMRLSCSQKPGSTTYYNMEDGIETIRFSPNGVFRYGRELFYGSATGFFSFDPAAIARQQKSSTPSLVVSELFIDDRPFAWLDSLQRDKISEDQPFFTRKITIPSGIQKFSVEFSLLAYQNQGQCRYAYRLKGYDRDWHYTDAENREATYQNLPSGSYELMLRAVDSYGNQVDMPYSIDVRVLPPWYRTWWAYLIWLMLLGAIVLGIIRWYQNYLKTKNRLAMAVVFTNITHELLTPLTIISASIDEMRHRAPQFTASYGLMQNNIQRLTRLLRQILEVRKSQAGQLKLLVARGDLAKFIATECENIRPMTGVKNGELFVNCPAEGIDAWFDKDKVDKILYNLLSNAVKYNKEGGRIIVTLTAEKQQAVLKVSDEGIGITKDKMKHLYTRFLDGDYRKMNTLGTGIGLALTRDLVMLHHGKIDCQSRVGEGTTFIVTLPINKNAYTESEIDLTADNKVLNTEQLEYVDESALAADIGTEEAEEKDHAILLVEDNHELLLLMKNLFIRHYNVYTAHNGQQALGIIHRQDLDVVVTDVMMPVMDGIELTRTIKDSEDYGQLPVVMLTAKTTDEDRNTGYETGADAYITKPFKMADLQLRIDNIIQNRERIRRKFSSQMEFKVEDQHYSSPDEVFIQKAIGFVKQHLDDSDYDRERFASDMCVSSSTLYNKLRALTGQSVTGFINAIRLKESCRIARQRPGISISELAMEVGFNTPKYFTKLFKKEFGMLPSEFMAESPNA